METYRDRFRANPNDANAALQYGKALRATGQRSQAVAVLEQATIAHPGNKPVLAGYDQFTTAVLSVVFSTACGALFGMLSLRASGIGFLMITLALGQIVWGIAYRAITMQAR